VVCCSSIEFVGTYQGDRSCVCIAFYTVLQCVPVCCSLLHRVASCCIVLHRVAVNLERVYLLYLPAPSISTSCSVLQCVCSVLQCVAVCCSVLQCVTVCCSVLQCVAVLATKQIEVVLEKKI